MQNASKGMIEASFCTCGKIVLNTFRGVAVYINQHTAILEFQHTLNKRRAP